MNILPFMKRKPHITADPNKTRISILFEQPDGEAEMYSGPVCCVLKTADGRYMIVVNELQSKDIVEIVQVVQDAFEPIIDAMRQKEGQEIPE